jgi:hypothetical protein
VLPELLAWVPALIFSLAYYHGALARKAIEIATNATMQARMMIPVTTMAVIATAFDLGRSGMSSVIDFLLFLAIWSRRWELAPSIIQDRGLDAIGHMGDSEISHLANMDAHA